MSYMGLGEWMEGKKCPECGTKVENKLMFLEDFFKGKKVILNHTNIKFIRQSIDRITREKVPRGQIEDWIMLMLRGIFEACSKPR